MAKSVIQSESLNLADNFAFTGTVTGSGSNIKEHLAMLCDGGSYTVPSATYTSQNVTTHQLLTSSYQDITGSVLSYTPPTGTLAVIYNFIFEFRQASTHHGIGHFKLFIDSDEVVDGRQGMSAAQCKYSVRQQGGCVWPPCLHPRLFDSGKH